MMRKDWKKQLKRVRDIADKNFTRSERPEQLNESLVRLEQRIDNIKLVCQAVGKKLLACLQLHGVEREKRLKKLPESALSKQLHESSSTFDEKETIRQTLFMCGNVEGDLASMLMSYEDNIESSVLQPLQTLLERDIPTIMKLRKQVAKQTQEVESLKSRHSTRQTMVIDKSTEGTKKINQALEDLEEAANKLELYKDQLATEMFNFYAREGELNKIFTFLIESQLRYHADATAALQRVLPEMKLIEETARRPVFGCSLEDHLHLTKQPIATVISESITALLTEGLEQEGLFRIAGGATKLKKLKAAFDAGMVDMEEHIIDPHCVASVLKLYLRELPEPLLTYELYDDWAEASQLPPDQRLNAIASNLQRMKRPYFDNLKYLIQFLAKLADNAEVNKMSATNLAIVVGPNLLWSRNSDGQNILTTGVQSSITECMISNAAFLFGDGSFGDRNKSNCLTQVSATVSASFGNNNNTNNNNSGDNARVADRISIAASQVPLSTQTCKSTHISDEPPDSGSLGATWSQTRVPSSSNSNSAARRFQAQKDFWCRRVDSVSVRSWPERPMVSRRHEPRQNSGLALHESFLQTRPFADYGISIQDDSHPTDFGVRETHRLPKVTTLRPSPPKSVHSEMYSTAFALQSLGDVNCSAYLAKVRTLWDSHMEVNKKRTPNFDMSKSCQGDTRAVVITPSRQLSLTEGRVTACHGLLSQPKMTCSDSELGEMTAHVIPSSQSPSASSRSHSRNDSNSVATKQTIGKGDSSDSLSSDSLCAESAVVANASSNSSSEVSSVARSSEMPDVSNRVAPRRTVKKPQAPLPPSTDATVASFTKTPATSGHHEAPTSLARGATTTVQAKVAVATEETPGDSAAKPSTVTVHAKVAATTAQAKVAVAAEETDPPRKLPAAVESNPVVTAAGDEKLQPVGAKRRTQFAANQALISNILTGPRKLLLTRPNTVYMDHAKQELIKTAEEDIDSETTTPKSETNGAGIFLGKTGDGMQADGSQVPQKTKPSLLTGEDQPTRDAKKDEPSTAEMCAAAELIGNLELEDETKNPSPLLPRRSDGANTAEELVRKKPERPSKPVRPSNSDEGGRKSPSVARASGEDHSGKEDSVAESSSAAKAHSESNTGAKTQSANTAKHPKHPPPEVPLAAPQLPPSGGAGLRPPKPPPPSVAPGSRLPSDTGIEEDTYL